MTLPSSGLIGFLDIQNEFGGAAPIDLGEYYGAAAGIPGSGTISISQFYGKSAYHTTSRVTSQQTTTSWTSYWTTSWVTSWQTSKQTTSSTSGCGGSPIHITTYWNVSRTTSQSTSIVKTASTTTSWWTSWSTFWK